MDVSLMQSQHQEERGVGDMEGNRENKELDGVGIIPTDVLSGILIRLPLKSLGQFKIVSKPWQSLIEDRNFVRSHYRRSLEENDTSRQYLNVEVSPYNNEKQQGRTKCYQVDKYDKPTICYEYKVRAFCEGLVCYLGMDEDIHVVNPITQQALTLPKPQYLRDEDKGILFKPRKYALGFGFDSVSNKYKVVIVVSGITKTCSGFHTSLLAKMYELGSKSKSWKTIDSGILFARFPFVGSAVYANGASHWRTWEHDIVSFNFTQEKFGVIPVLKEMVKFFCNSFDHEWKLCKKGEHLCVIGIVEVSRVEEVKLWTLANYDETTPEWVVQKIIMPFELIYKRVRFITAATGDELWIVCADHNESFKTNLYSYNEHGAVVNSREVRHFPENYGFTGFHVESLVNPKSI